MNLQWNVADESALEAANRLKGPATAVTVLTMGPGKLEAPLRELFARGADRAVLLTDPVMAGADTRATAAALAAAVGKLGTFDLILCGRRALEILGKVYEQNRLVSQAFSAKIMETGEAAKRMNEMLAAEKSRVEGRNIRMDDYVRQLRKE